MEVTVGCSELVRIFCKPLLAVLEVLWRAPGSAQCSKPWCLGHTLDTLGFFHCVAKMFMTKMQITAARLANVHDALKGNVLCEFLAPV